MAVQTYRDLIAWRRATDPVVETYQLTRQFPPDQLNGLTRPVRRSAVAVPSDIAEGRGRGVGAEFAHHLNLAGALQEMETQILLAERLQYIRAADLDPVPGIAAEVGRLNRGLQKSLP